MVSGHISRRLVRQFRETQAPAGGIVLWSLGHASIVLKVAGCSEWLAIDPYLTAAIEQRNPMTEFVRAYDPIIQPCDLAGTESVLVTHAHDDHLDFETLCPLAAASPQTTFVVPAPHLAFCEANGLARNRLVGIAPGETYETAGCAVSVVSAAHPTHETDAAGNPVSVGYLIHAGGIRIYFAGDTLCTDTLIREVSTFAPHIAFLPINGGDYWRTARGIAGNLSAREAVDFAVSLGVEMVFPVHYDLFPNNRDNPANFPDYLLQHYPTQRFHMLAPGERFFFVPDAL